MQIIDELMIQCVTSTLEEVAFPKLEYFHRKFFRRNYFTRKEGKRKKLIREKKRGSTK